MANNIILTPQVYTRLTLMHLGGYLAVCRNMTKEYTKELGKKDYKVGDTVSVRKPQRFLATTGLQYQPQALTNTRTTITVNDVTGVHFEFDSIEKTLSIQDASQYAKPSAIALAHNINSRAAQFVAQNTWNAVGTPGTTPTTIDTYLAAGDKIVQGGLPPDEDLSCIVSRKFSSQFVVGQKTYFNPAGQISNIIKKGEITNEDPTLGFRWQRDQTIYNQTIGPLGGTPLVNGSGQTADGGNNATMSLLTKGWTAAAASRLVVGDRFTIANVYSVHPQTKQSTGDLQQFVVQAAFSSDASGNGSVTIAPAITISGQYQNVTASPIDGAAITVFGTANTVSPQALLMHMNAYAFCSIPLEDPISGKGVESAEQETDPDTGLTLSFIRFFDGVNRIHGNRFDTLDGFGRLYSEMACVIAG